MKLSKRKIKQIEVWVKLSSAEKKAVRTGCPFDSDGGLCMRNLNVAAKICYKAFPRTAKHGGDCPCAEYTLDYVIKKARQMIKTGEV